MKKKKIFKILVIVVACILLIGLVAAVISKIKDDSESTESSVSLSWSSGNISTTTGKYVEDETSIYSSEFDCYGLSIALDYDQFESDVPYTYAIYYYDFDGEYLSYESGLNTDYSADVPIQAKSCRLVLTANDGESISFIEKYSYTRKITVTVAKDQPESLYALLTSLEDICEIEGNGAWYYPTMSVIDAEDSPFYFSKQIDTTNADTAYIRVATSSLTNTVTYEESEFDCILIFSNETTTSTFYESYSVIYSESNISYISVDVSELDWIQICVDSATLSVLTVAVI